MGNGIFPTLIILAFLSAYPRLLPPGAPWIPLIPSTLLHPLCVYSAAQRVQIPGGTIGGPEVALLNLVAARRTAAFL